MVESYFKRTSSQFKTIDTTIEQAFPCYNDFSCALPIDWLYSMLLVKEGQAVSKQAWVSMQNTKNTYNKNSALFNTPVSLSAVQPNHKSLCEVNVKLLSSHLN